LTGAEWVREQKLKQKEKREDLPLVFFLCFPNNFEPLIFDAFIA
jgi:hypothetical protein